MIYVQFKISWARIWRDPVTLIITFLLPILFFTIFSMAFGSFGQGTPGHLVMLVADEDQSEQSERFLDELSKVGPFELQTSQDDRNEEPVTRIAAWKAVRQGHQPLAIVIPAGFGSETWSPDIAPLEILVDPANPLAAEIVSSHVRETILESLPELVLQRAIAVLESTNVDYPVTDTKTREYNQTELAGSNLIPVVISKVYDENDEASTNRPLVAYFAAGIGAIFLLFSTAGLAGTLLEEEEIGLLDRLLCTDVGMTQIIISKWLFISSFGALQLCVMFFWGWLAFGLQLWTLNNFIGFIIMTLLSSLAAGAFGVLLATAARSRHQLSGFSMIIILVMSAVGGSMIPRFFMPEIMQNLGYLTFNTWSLMGYQEVFWYALPGDSLGTMLLSLWDIAVTLLCSTMICLVIARQLARRRWEAG